MEARKFALVSYVVQASEEQLESLERVAFPSESDLYSKLELSDIDTTNYITSLPVSVVVQLFKYLSVEDALKLCRLNKEFGRWCDENGFINELHRNANIRDKELLEQAEKIAKKFTGTSNIEIVIEKDYNLVYLDDSNGDSGFRVNANFDVIADYVLALLPIPKTVDTWEQGFGEGESRRWFWEDMVQEDVEIVNRFQRRSTEPDSILVVTRQQMDYYTTFFYNLLKAGWTVQHIFNTSETGRMNPTEEYIESCITGCDTCGFVTDQKFMCNLCVDQRQYCKSCGETHLYIHK